MTGWRFKQVRRKAVEIPGKTGLPSKFPNEYNFEMNGYEANEQPGLILFSKIKDCILWHNSPIYDKCQTQSA